MNRVIRKYIKEFFLIGSQSIAAKQGKYTYFYFVNEKIVIISA